MYTVDTNIKDLRVKERPLHRLFFSLNSPMIATPELGTEDARCYIMLFKEGSSYTSYIGLYLPSSDRRFFYVYSGNPVAESGLDDLLEESNRFAEEMGFLLDELNLAGMSVDARTKWIDEQPFFGYVKETEEKSGEAPVEAEAVKPEDTVEAPEEMPAEQLVAAPVEDARPPVAPAPEVFTVSPASPLPSTEEAHPPATALEDAFDIPGDAPAEPEEPEIDEQPAPIPKRSAVFQKAPRQSAPLQPAPEEEEEHGENDSDEEAAPLRQQREKTIRTLKRQKKNQPSSTGTVSKEYEALARLLSSF